MSVEERIARSLEKMAEGHAADVWPEEMAAKNQAQRHAFEIDADLTKAFNEIPRFEATNLDLNVSLPGEQAFIALISLIETMFEGATPEQKEQLIAFHIQNVEAWNKFWKVGE